MLKGYKQGSVVRSLTFYNSLILSMFSDHISKRAFILYTLRSCFHSKLPDQDFRVIVHHLFEICILVFSTDLALRSPQDAGETG